MELRNCDHTQRATTSSHPDILTSQQQQQELQQHQQHLQQAFQQHQQQHQSDSMQQHDYQIHGGGGEVMMKAEDVMHTVRLRLFLGTFLKKTQGTKINSDRFDKNAEKKT